MKIYNNQFEYSTAEAAGPVAFTCIQVLERITCAENYGRGNKSLIELALVKMRLEAWRRTFLKSDDQLIAASGSVKESLLGIESILSNVDELQKKYGLLEGSHSMSLGLVTASPTTQAFASLRHAPKTDSETLSNQTSILGESNWAIDDSLKFAHLAVDLSAFVDDLENSSDPGVRHLQCAVVDAMISEIPNRDTVELFHSAKARGSRRNSTIVFSENVSTDNSQQFCGIVGSERRSTLFTRNRAEGNSLQSIGHMSQETYIESLNTGCKK